MGMVARIRAAGMSPFVLVPADGRAGRKEVERSDQQAAR
jgi:hypothetical protein